MYTLLQGREQQAKVNKTKDFKENEMAPKNKYPLFSISK